MGDTMPSPGSDAAGDVVAHLAILGRHAMLPSIKPFMLDGREILVGHAYVLSAKDDFHGVEIDVSDCTVFNVVHRGRGQSFDVDNADHALQLFDDSLTAISEVILWERAHEQVGKSSPFQRRVGRIDVKFFSIDGEKASSVMWRNPLFFADLDGMSLMAGFLGNMVMSNGPAANPLPADTKRMMSSIDLVNLGFFTEAFIAAFTLLDDLTQRVVLGGLAKKGFSTKDQRQFVRSVKEERLDHYFNSIAKLCDWTALKDADAALNSNLLKTNRLRNEVMHGDRELSRAEALTSIDVVAQVINHLRANPFDVHVADFPPLRPAKPQLVRMQDPPRAEPTEDEVQ